MSRVGTPPDAIRNLYNSQMRARTSAELARGKPEVVFFALKALPALGEERVRARAREENE